MINFDYISSLTMLYLMFRQGIRRNMNRIINVIVNDHKLTTNIDVA